jgi:hypothetical protein
VVTSKRRFGAAARAGKNISVPTTPLTEPVIAILSDVLRGPSSSTPFIEDYSSERDAGIEVVT